MWKLSVPSVAFGLIAAVTLTGQERPPSYTPPVINSEMVGLPPHNKRTATPDEPRVYHGVDGKVNRARQPVGYPKIPTSDVRLERDEVAQYHNALDLQSRREMNSQPEPLPYKAGVYGTVLFADTGKVLVMSQQGNVIHYLHGSDPKVKFGDTVTPDTVLGQTGNWMPGAMPYQKGAIHLHMQATDVKGDVIDVDRTFLAGRKEVNNFSSIKPVEREWVDFQPIYTSGKIVVKDGVLKVEESRRVYYDDDAPKGVGADLTKELPGTYENYRDNGDVWQHLTLKSDLTFSYHWFNLMNERNAYDGTWKYEAKSRQVLIATDKQGGGVNYYVIGDKAPYSLSASKNGADPLKKK